MLKQQPQRYKQGSKAIRQEKKLSLKIENEEEKKPGESKDDVKEEEVIDIDLTDPDVEVAATKIQAGFKGHKTRKEMKSKSEKETKEEKKQSEKEEEEIDIDLTDPDVEAAATKIQAGFKGHKTRKEMKETKKNAELDEVPEKELDAEKDEKGKEEGEEENEDAIDIDLTDPD